MPRLKPSSRQARIRQVINGPFRWLFAVISLSAVAFLGYIIWFYATAEVTGYNAAIVRAENEPVREMILSAARQYGWVAPIDAKSGDLYFTKAKLYVPQQATLAPYAFRYYWDNDSAELTVVNPAVIERDAVRLIGAADTKQLFDSVPKLQACLRGAVVTFNKQQTSLTAAKLKQQFLLADGRTARIYIDQACPENGGTAEMLASLRTY